MRIGIDASRATAARRTGTENYSLHLIRALLALDGPHEFRLYFNQPPPPDLFPVDVEQRVIPFPRLWTHVRLSWEMARQAPDLLFVPSHVLPLIHPRRSVVTVHDLGYHYYPETHTLSQNLYLRASTRFNARAAARLVADSEATRRDLMRYYGTPGDKISVVYPGRDESLAPVRDAALLAAVRERYGLRGSYLLYVGTLHPRKNLARLVQAFGALGPGGPVERRAGVRLPLPVRGLWPACAGGHGLRHAGRLFGCGLSARGGRRCSPDRCSPGYRGPGSGAGPHPD